MIIRCVGNRLQVKVNGQEVINLDLQKTKLKDRKSEGYIGLQDHGHPHAIRFRNIKIKEIKSAKPDENAKVLFRREVLPVFQNKCLDCHGEDEQEGNLRLDSLTHIMRGGDSGEPVVLPGDDTNSYLVHLLLTDDKKHRMPLNDHPLSDSEIELIRKWIRVRNGWESAIAAAKIRKSDHWSFQTVQKPKVPGPADQNPIDAFVAAKLKQNGLSFSNPANSRQLIRRLFLVVHGLPPTPGQIQAFEKKSKDPKRWEKLVESALKSPHYGEQMAVRWLDLIRFSETDGFEINAERPRAWRYRDWVIRAFNKDMPYDQFVTRQLTGDVIGDPIATAFLVAGPHNTVIEQDKRGQAENVQNEVSDFLNATGTTLLGLTIGCARCHNHKFDPISQTDFYSLQAVFSGVNHGQGKVPSTPQRKQELKKVISEIAGLQNDLKKFQVKSTKKDPVNALKNVESFKPLEARFVRMKIFATSGNQACIDELEVFSGQTNLALASAGAKATSGGDFVHVRHKLTHINDGKYGNPFSWIPRKVKGWVQIELAQSARIDRIVWGRDRTGKIRDRLATGYHFEVSLDGKNWTKVGDSSQRRSKGEPKIVYQFDQLSPQEKKAALAKREQLEKAQARHKELQKLPMAYIGTFKPTSPTYRLFRGDPMAPREEVIPNTIGLIGNLALSKTATGPHRRKTFAKWVTARDNPLTARVMVNRIWQLHFGTGLVSTPNDFGLNGSPPSHPELLDWLAAEFMENGWSTKHIHRLILTSKTWQQDSRPRKAALSADANSRWLWRFPPRRLAAESIRDSILATTGKLNRTAGGPGFSGFKVHVENVRHYFPKKKYGPEDWRRMVYMTRVRKEVESVFGAFDCPDGNQVTPRRTRSTTPLQALNLLNSRFVIQQSEFFANDLKTNCDSTAEMVERSYELCFGRKPTQAESKLASEMIRELGLVQYCRVMLNANEFVFIL